MKRKMKKGKRSILQGAKRSARIFLAGTLFGALIVGVGVEAMHALASALETGSVVVFEREDTHNTTPTGKNSPQGNYEPIYEPCALKDVVCEYETKMFNKKAFGTTYNAEVAQTDSDPFTMANGKRVNEQAVASNCYKLGTKVEVEGMGIFTVEDRMNTRFTPLCGSDAERMDFFKWKRADNFAKAVKFRIIE